MDEVDKHPSESERGFHDLSKEKKHRKVAQDVVALNKITVFV